MAEYAYSLDNENYDGPYSKVSDAQRAALLEVDEPDQQSYWIAEVVPAEEYLDAPLLGDKIANMINLELSGCINGDEAPVYVDWDDSRRLGQMVIDFLRNSGSFERFGVREAKEYLVEAP